VANGRELLRLNGHSEWVLSVAFSMDGQRIVTGGDDSTARVWEAASGRELLTLKARNAIKSVGFSRDGHRIVSGSVDNTAIVWEAARPEQVAAWQQEERAAVLDRGRRFHPVVPETAEVDPAFP
jgi:eukaryotic-like serine/threonine-protein kinase